MIDFTIEYEYEGQIFILEDSFISPLGYLILKLRDQKTNSVLKFNLGSFEDFLKQANKSNNKQ